LSGSGLVECVGGHLGETQARVSHLARRVPSVGGVRAVERRVSLGS